MKKRSVFNTNKAPVAVPRGVREAHNFKGLFVYPVPGESKAAERSKARVSTRNTLPYVKTYRDKCGVQRRYFRRKGCPSVALIGEPGTAAFAASYESALQQKPGYRARSGRTMGYVYAIRVIGFDLVKIGYSLAPKRRLAELENGSGMVGGLDMLLSFPAKPAIERALHEKFKAERLFGEWFRLSGTVADWLDANGDLPGRRLNRLSDIKRASPSIAEAA